MRKISRQLSYIKRGTLLFLCLVFIFPTRMIFADTIETTETAETEEVQNNESTLSVDPVYERDNYSAVIYNNTNGLPTSEANDIVQTSEGFIWIGSYSGLIRYDGNTFERADSTTGVASVTDLYVDQKDRLWIGTNDSGVALMEQNGFRMWKEEDGLGSAKVCTIAEDDKGTIYVGTTEGISMIDADMNLTAVEDPRIAHAYIRQISSGSDGLLHCITNEDEYFTLRDGRLVDYMDHAQIGEKKIACILADQNASGMLYIGTADSGFYHGNLTQDKGGMDYVDISPLYDVFDIEQYGDRVWISAINGIGVLDSQGFHQLKDLPMDNSISKIMADYEGNLWLASSRQGVMKLVSNQFLDIFARYNLPQAVVNSTCIYDDRLFIGTDTGLMVLDDKKRVRTLPLSSAKTASGEDLGFSDLLEMLDGCRIRSQVRDSRGRLWISTWRSRGLLCYDGDSVTAFTVDDGLISDHVRVVCEMDDGSILAVVTGGLNVIRDNRVAAGYGEKEGISNSESLTAAVAPNGDIVLGSNGGGIYIINEEGVRCISTREGLTSGIVMRIKYDSDHHVFWIVTSNSLAWMSEDYQVTTVQNFPYSNNFDIYENSKGDLWILSSNGIYISPVAELLENQKINPVHYGIANGLPYIATSNSYSELTPEGSLYIAGNAGVAKVNVENPLEIISDLKQTVPYIEVDGKRLFPDETGGFRIPSDTQKLTIYGFVFNYMLTDPLVSYWLEGFDREPVTVRRSELAPVSYTNLPGRSYQFVMEIKDAMGRGSNKLTVSIIKEKTLFEQAWFYLVVGTCTAILLGILTQAYVRRKMSGMEKKHKEQAERAQLEKELQMARQIQASMLPSRFPAFPERRDFDIFASMNPARDIGGDFYDYFLIDDDHLGLVIADVAGKGIPAALFMMVSKTLIENSALAGLSPAKTLETVNRQICENNQEEMFVTVWLGVLELSSGKLIAANGGHEYPVLKTPDGDFSLFNDFHGLVVGGMDGTKYRDYELTLLPGAKLFVYTDGVPEATDTDGRFFGIDRLLDALNGSRDDGPAEILRDVRYSVDTFVGDAEQFDDLTMLCLVYNGPLSADT